MHSKFSTIHLPFTGLLALDCQIRATDRAARFVYHGLSDSYTVYQQSQDLMLQCTLPAKRRYHAKKDRQAQGYRHSDRQEPRLHWISPVLAAL